MRFDVVEGPAGAATVLLSSGLGGAAAYWSPQLPELQARYRVVTYDQAGTGRNRFTLPDGYSIGNMADEVLAILDASGAESCHFVGHALGGLVGLELALRAPARLRSLSVVNGWAKADAHTIRCFEARLALLEHGGAEAYVRAQPIFLYPAAWLADHEAAMVVEDTHGVAGFQGAETLRRRIAALLAFDVTARLGEVAVPTFIVAARDDVLVAYRQSERLAAGIRGARLHVEPAGAHAVNVTEAKTFNAALLSFLADAG